MVSSVLIYPDVITLLGSNIAQAGATFGVAAKTKDKELREMAIPAGISALLAGVTEPVNRPTEIPVSFKILEIDA